MDSTFTLLANYSGGLLPECSTLTGILSSACILLPVLVCARRKARVPTTRHTTPGADLWFRIVLVFAMALPMLVLYATSTLGLLLSRDLHFKPELLGYLIMSSFGLAAILSLWAGAFVDRFGSRYSLIILFSAIALAFALMVTVQNFYGLVAAVGVCGIAQALANPVTNLLIAQQVPPEKKAMVVGLKQAGVQLAALFAGLVLPGIAIATSWRFALAMIIPLAFIFIITTPFITPKKHTRTGKGFTLSLPNPLLFRLMSIQFCVGISLSAFVTFLPTFAAQQGMPLSLAGTLIAVFGAMGIISRMVLTPMGAKLKDESLLLLALIAIAAVAMAVTMQASPEQYWPLWVGAVGVGLTAVGTNAIAMSMLIRDPAFGAVTSASGFVSVAFFGGFALGPPLYGVLSDYSGGLLLGWSTLIGVLVVGCIMALVLASARRRKVQPQDENAQLKSEVLLLKERLNTLEGNYYAVLTKLAELSNAHASFNNENSLPLQQIEGQLIDLKSLRQSGRNAKRQKKTKNYRNN
ncbi:MAG TPA: MFS transporter [Methylobacter sp.]|jgi:MFS family permease